MVSTFFSSASIGSVSAVILFLMTYMPYIVIIALGTVLSTFSKVLAVSYPFDEIDITNDNVSIFPICRVFPYQLHSVMPGIIFYV